MADLLKSLEAFPSKRKLTDKTWDEHAKEFIKSLNALSIATWTKPVNKQNILDVLNPAINSLPYIYALNQQSTTIGKDRSRAEEWINYATVFLASFDPIQIRYVDEQWRDLIDVCFTILSGLNIRDFTPIVTGLLRLDPTGGTFTTNHLRLLRHCLTAGCPSQVLPLLDHDIYAFPQKPTKNMPEELLNEESDLSNGFITEGSAFSGKPKLEHVLEYYLLGAGIYIGNRKFGRARLFLEYIILTPSSGHGSSALQMEAYKKWILLGLLSEGRRFPLPRTSDQQLVKSLRATSKAYEALAEDFEKRDHRKFQAEAETGMQVWQDDGNVRFVKEVADALFRYRVVDLQKTYAALPVSRVTSLLDLEASSVQQMLSNMIRAGQLRASITPSSAGDAVLRFHSAPSNMSTTGDDSLEAQTKRIEKLVASIKDADRRLRLTNEYVTYERRSKRSAAGPDGDLAEQMDLTWDAPIAGMADDDDGDEDIMA